MTPTDALIEKMARAIALRNFGKKWSWEEMSPRLRREYTEDARAAYSAEHEEDGK